MQIDLSEKKHQLANTFDHTVRNAQKNLHPTETQFNTEIIVAFFNSSIYAIRRIRPVDTQEILKFFIKISTEILKILSKNTSSIWLIF